MQFSIHQMGKLAPEFIESILAIDREGFDCDYISERLLLTTAYSNGRLQTAAGTRYKGLIIPGSGEMPDRVKEHIDSLQALGACIIYGTDKKLMGQAAQPEELRTACGLKTIRRKNDKGFHYFIANLSPRDICQKVKLAVPFKDARWFNPLNGEISNACIHHDSITITLRSGESMILQTFDKQLENCQQAVTDKRQGKEFALEGPWTLSFIEEAPKVEKTYQLEKLQTWETLDEQTKVVMGTGVYTTRFTLSEEDGPAAYGKIDLGDVRESARVYLNGQLIGCAWSVPFVLSTKGLLHAGENEIRIEVTNLPANRISELDRQGYKWRKMEEINVVDINYKKTTYADWEPVASGLNGPVRLVCE